MSRRNEVAKQLRARGDSEAADGVRALKKPSRVAWLLNQLSGREAKLREELLEAGAALREAQEQLVAGKADSAGLRAAGARERAAVGRALEAVEAIAAAAGAGLSANASERAGKTLHAVALDEGVREDFKRHRLATDHDAPGLGGLLPGAPGAARKAGRPTGSATNDNRQEAKRRREELKAAEAEAVKLAGRQEEAEREVDAAHQSAKQAQQILTGAIERLDKATADAAAARQRVDDLERSAT